MIIEIEILGQPTSQPRHRHFKRGNFSGTYDPAKDAKNSFLSCMMHYAPSRPVETEICMEIIFCFLRPKSHFGTGRNAGKLKKKALFHYIKKPDIDNLQKFVLDSMNKVFFRDDSQVYRVIAEKRYSDVAKTKITMFYRGGEVKNGKI